MRNATLAPRWTRTMLPLLAVTLGAGAGCFEKIDILAGTTPTTPTDGGVRDTARVPCGTSKDQPLADGGGLACGRSCNCSEVPVDVDAGGGGGGGGCQSSCGGHSYSMTCDVSGTCICTTDGQSTGTTTTTGCAGQVVAWTEGCKYPGGGVTPPPPPPSCTRQCSCSPRPPDVDAGGNSTGECHSSCGGHSYSMTCDLSGTCTCTTDGKSTGTTTTTGCAGPAAAAAWTTGCGYPNADVTPTAPRTCAFPKDPFGNIAAIAGVQQCVNGFWSDCSVDCKAPAGTTHPCLTCALAKCSGETSAVICTKYRDLYCQLLGASTTCNVIGVAINACTSPALEQAYCGGANPVACTAVRCNGVCDVERKKCDALNPPYPQCRDAEDVCNAACEAKSPLLTTLNTLLTCSKTKCPTECGASAQKWLEVGRSICKISPPATKPDAGIVGRADGPRPTPKPDMGPVQAPDAAAVAGCSNGTKDGTETDVDCGGSGCPKCAIGMTCFVAADCQSAVCSASRRCAGGVVPAPDAASGFLPKDASAKKADAGGVAPKPDGSAKNADASGPWDGTGTWTGTWVLEPPFFSGALTLDVVQSGSTFTGTTTFGGSPCFTTGAVSGTITGASLTGTMTPVGATISFTANGSPTNLTGAFQVISGTCTGSIGTFALTR